MEAGRKCGTLAFTLFNKPANTMRCNYTSAFHQLPTDFPLNIGEQLMNKLNKFGHLIKMASAASLRYYKSEGYGAINTLLRSTHVENPISDRVRGIDPHTAELRSHIRNIDGSMQPISRLVGTRLRHSPREDLTVYRGVNFPNAEMVLSRGSLFDMSFMSTSLDIENAKKFAGTACCIIVITVPHILFGEVGAYLYDDDSGRVRGLQESELLFERNIALDFDASRSRGALLKATLRKMTDEELHKIGVELTHQQKSCASAYEGAIKEHREKQQRRLSELLGMWEAASDEEKATKIFCDRIRDEYRKITNMITDSIDDVNDTMMVDGFIGLV